MAPFDCAQGTGARCVGIGATTEGLPLRRRGAPTQLDAPSNHCHTICMTGRLNARVPDEVARKVRYLQARLGQSTTDVVIASLEAYYDQVTREEAPARLLEDFIGCAAGPGNLSRDYKKLMLSSLEAKHGLRASKVEDDQRPHWGERTPKKKTKFRRKRRP